MRKLVLAGVLATGVFAAGSSASAQDVLRPGTHPGYVGLLTGPGVGVSLAGGGSAFGWNVTLAGGYHFSGNSGGAAFGGDIAMTIGFQGGFQMLFAPRFTYDIQIGNTGFYIGPTAALGLGFITAGGGGGFVLSPSLGVDLKFVLADRGLIWIRPFSLGFPIWMGSVGGFSGAVGNMQIDFVNFGGGVTF